LLAHDLLALHPGVADRRRPSGPPTCLEKIRTETKNGPTEHHQRFSDFLQKAGRDMSENGVTTGKKPFDCDKNMLETENDADSRPNHGRSSLPLKIVIFCRHNFKKTKSLI
jgi:hypothetical protein